MFVTYVPTPDNLLGVLVIGVNPHKRPDEAFYNFARMLSTSLCAALLAARDHQRERQKAQQLAELDRVRALVVCLFSRSTYIYIFMSLL